LNECQILILVLISLLRLLSLNFQIQTFPNWKDSNFLYKEITSIKIKMDSVQIQIAFSTREKSLRLLLEPNVCFDVLILKAYLRSLISLKLSREAVGSNAE